jgi:uncharacterized delta-60 repeat protein
MKNLLKRILNVFAFVCSTIILSFAQGGAMDHSFNPGDFGYKYGSGPNAEVRACIVLPNGKIMIGGYFYNYNGTGKNFIVKLNSDGSMDTTFKYGTGPNGILNSLILQNDGKVLIGGDFTNYNGTIASGIARIHPNGALDTTFHPGVSLLMNVIGRKIAMQSDGKIIVINSNGNLARLNSNGSVDTTFYSVGGLSGGNGLTQIVILNDDKIVIAGSFDTYGGEVRRGLARIKANGTLDTTFNPSGFTYFERAYRMLIQADGKILVSTYLSGSSEGPNLKRLNSNGSIDTTFLYNNGYFNKNLGFIQNDGKIIIHEGDDRYALNPVQKISRLNANGSYDSTFFEGARPDDYVGLFTPQNDGKFLIAGIFERVNTFQRSRFTRLNANGSLDTLFNKPTGANNKVGVILPLSNGKILLGGMFTGLNGISCNSIGRLNSNGSTDTTFHAGASAYQEVKAMALQADGKILLGGAFTRFNGVLINRVVRIYPDGALDTTFNPGLGATGGDVNAIAIQSDGKIVIAGSFTSYNGVARSRLTRLNINGSIDTSFNIGSGPSGSVNAMAIQADGKVVIGGSFQSYASTGRYRVARVNTNGSLDLTFNNGSLITNDVNAVLIESSGKVYVAGEFSVYLSTNYRRILRLNTDGTVDNTFLALTSSGITNIYALDQQSDGKLLVGGNMYDGTINFVRYKTNGSFDLPFYSGMGPDNTVYAIARQSDGNILIGGIFNAYNNVGRNCIARVAANCANTQSSILVNGCGSYWSPSTKYTWTMNGIYNDTIVNAWGCDSVITINLVFKNKTYSSINMVSCDRYYAPSGRTSWTSSGVYKDSIPNSGGCDSVITINLTIKPKSLATISKTVCNSFISPSGKHTYTQSGIYQDTLTNAVGCDSLITINLAVSRTFSTINPKVCTSYQSPSLKYTWATTGTYKDTLTNSAGCDSIVTINLVVNTSTFSTINPKVCASYKSPSLKYTWATTGTYKDTITNASGCDSIITINLVVGNIPVTNSQVNACGSYRSPSTKYTWSTSGLYLDTLKTKNGCDSVIAISLTIPVIDTSIIVSGDTMHAQAFSSSFQWLNCNQNYAVVPGAVGKSFVPAVGGMYAVEITKANCADTSSCYRIVLLGLKETGTKNNLEIYPNPNNGTFTISPKIVKDETFNIEIFNQLGAMVYNSRHDFKMSNNDMSLKLSEPKGIYFIRVSNGITQIVKKIVLE